MPTSSTRERSCVNGTNGLVTTLGLAAVASTAIGHVLLLSASVNCPVVLARTWRELTVITSLRRMSTWKSGAHWGLADAARLLVVAVLVASGLALVSAAPTAAAAPERCFGQPVTIQAVPGQRTVGTQGPDVIAGTAGPDVIIGRGGDDRICSQGGDDLVRGGGGNDRIRTGGTAATGNRIDGGAGRRDLCLGGRGTSELDRCEQVGGTRRLHVTDFAGIWDVAYADPRLYAVPGPCADRTPELRSEGFFMFLDVCGDTVDIGNFTPAALCADVTCRYPFSSIGLSIARRGPGSFGFTLFGGTRRPGATISCGRTYRIPGGWRIEVTDIGPGNQPTGFRWRTPADNCRTVFGETTGWAATVEATVTRQ